MQVEVLYIAGCPNHTPAVERVREVLRAAGMAEVIGEVEICTNADAEGCRFFGSPTVRVDGCDVEPEARAVEHFGIGCRSYAENGNRSGLPSKRLISRALQKSQMSLARSDIMNSLKGASTILSKYEKRKTHWERVYETHPEREVSWFENAPTVSFDLIRLNSKSPADSIVDIGGGNSHLVDLLLDASFSRICVVDVSSRAMKMAQARLGERATGVTWIESDVLEWLGPRDVDIWHDRAAYHFLTDPVERARYAEVAASRVVPLGTLIVQTFALEGPLSCSGLPIHRASADTIRADFAMGFDLVESFAHKHLTPSGATQLFQVCRLQRKSGQDGGTLTPRETPCQESVGHDA